MIRTVVVIATLLIATTSLPVSAQYFGQNKVRYDDLNFSVLQTTHFDVYFYDQERHAIDEAARLAERWYARMAALFNHELRGRQPLIMYASHADFEQTTVIPGVIGPATGGVTEQLQRRMVLPFTGSLEETSHVLGHELVHAFQFDIATGRSLALPLWFVEGMAEYLSIGPIHALTAAWLRDALIHDNLPGFDDLDDPEYFPYRFGHAAWAYLAGRFGDEVVGELFRLASAAGDPLPAIEKLTGTSIDELSALGTRLAVANIEIRAPIPGLFTGEVDYWPLPLEVFAFGDTGVAWTDADDPSFLGGSRQLVSSVGAGVRANVFGYLVTEFNAVRPLDREGRGWMFVFNIRPGF